MVGRAKELAILNEALHSNRAEMIVVYGRRRVGKTYMIEQFYNQPNICLVSLIGQSGANMATQLSNAKNRLFERHQIECSEIKTWMELFSKIQNYHQEVANSYEHFVLFIDELPWIATPKSGFMGALSYMWNSYFEKYSNISVVLCGSATSWMVKKVIEEKGGLHQRITRQIPLYPFNLQESELYLKERGFNYLSRKEIVDLYIILGGVAQYLSFLDPNKSITDNINLLCFTIGGQLQREFSTLFIALFGKKGIHQQVVTYLGKSKRRLFSANEISEKFNVKSDPLYRTLEELEMSGFISKENRYGRKKRDARYRLSDSFSAFHLKWMTNVTQQELMENHNYWQFISNSQSWISWSGYRFEAICHRHILSIKKALGISGVYTQTYYWQSQGNKDKNGAEIDMLIQRADKTVMIVEVKYYNQEFSISKSYAENLRRKIESFREEDKARNSIMLVMMTTYGIKQNSYSNMVNCSLDMGVLFEG